MRTNHHALRWGAILVACVGTPVFSASHLWVISEVASNADGTVQFVEMWTPAPNESFLAGKALHADGGSSDPFAQNLPPNTTANKYLLAATPAFAALPGAPAPDLILPAGFLDITGDTVQWHIYLDSVLAYGPGKLPTDGVHSLEADGSTGAASPKNFAGASFAPPPTANLTVAKLLPGFPDGSRLALAWEDGACMGGGQYHLVYGYGAGLPDAPGGSYVLSPAGLGQCAIPGPSKVWTGVPNPASDEQRLLWFLVLADDGVRESSWGKDSTGAERKGPGVGGASGQCNIVFKDLSSACN